MGSMEYLMLAYWALNGFFGLLGISHRLDVDEDGQPVYILGFLPAWLGFVGLVVFVVLFLAHILVPFLEPAELNVTQHFAVGRNGGNVTLVARWVRPWGGGFAAPGWWLTFYFVVAGLGPVGFYWAGWHITDALAAVVELPRFITLPEPPKVRVNLPRVEVKPHLPGRGDGVSATKLLGLEVRKDE